MTPKRRPVVRPDIEGFDRLVHAAAVSQLHEFQLTGDED